MKIPTHSLTPALPFPTTVLVEAIKATNRFMVTLPSAFKTTNVAFYTILNQRNLSGFVGEVLRHSIASLDSRFVPNPHPDGRPDLVNLSSPAAQKHFYKTCLDQMTGAPMRAQLAPFKYGGVEIKSTIGQVPNASKMSIGMPRGATVTGLNYWSHHAHECDLLGAYYDFSAEHQGAPQVKAAFFISVGTADWHKVSVGNPLKKKTSNTSLKSSAISRLYQSLAAYEDSTSCTDLLDRLGVAR